MNIPEHLKYSKSHEWVQFLTDTNVRIGITDFAQKQMGDIVFVNLPLVGDQMVIGESFCDIESVKAVADVYAPLTGDIAQINEQLDAAPETMNNAPYEAWIIEVNGITGTEELMDAAAYKAFCESEGA